MPKFKSVEELRQFRSQVQAELEAQKRTGTTIIIGMGTCGIAAGARDTLHAILEELRKRGIEAQVSTVGCIGMCAYEPLVDIQQAGGPRITYARVTSEKVPQLIEEHLVKGRVIKEWVIGRLKV